MLIGWVYVALGAVLLLAGVGIVCFQVLLYLMEGRWVPFSLINVGILVTSEEWFLHPNTWLGVHKILGVIPASLALIGLGYSFIVAGFEVMKQLPPPRQRGYFDPDS